MLEINSELLHPGKPWIFIPDNMERILNDLKTKTLDPLYENYGGFCKRDAVWTDEKYAKKYAGCAVFFGSFLTAPVFSVVTDDQELINKVEQLVKENMQTEAYAKAKKQYQEDEIERAKQHEKALEKLRHYNK